MTEKIYSKITGTGSFIPSESVSNEDFLSNEFYDQTGVKLDKPNREIIDKFREITTITHRRKASDDLVTSDMAFLAAEKALKSANMDKEDLDYIIVAHNFGDVKSDNKKSDIVPSIASRVKYKLGINNPYSIAYDITFGCPGWLQAMIQADYFLKSGDAKNALVIGAELLSRVSDPHDRDSMLYSDGAGAVVLQAKKSKEPVGILSHASRSDTLLHSKMLFMDQSFKPSEATKDNLYLKMNGRRLYQYALENVPKAVKKCLEKSKVKINDIKKVLIHQANGKMDDEILKRLFGLYGITELPENIMPMTISELGNSSVATIPTLLDLILKGKMSEHQINPEDHLIFASVGAGMNINAMVYKA